MASQSLQPFLEAVLEEKIVAYADNFGNNNAVLLLLAKTNRKLEYRRVDEKKRLIIQNAEGWTSTKNNEVKRRSNALKGRSITAQGKGAKRRRPGVRTAKTAAL